MPPLLNQAIEGLLSWRRILKAEWSPKGRELPFAAPRRECQVSGAESGEAKDSNGSTAAESTARKRPYQRLAGPRIVQIR
jgi:hypothetical protein